MRAPPDFLEDPMQLAIGCDDFFAKAEGDGYREFYKPGGEAERLQREHESRLRSERELDQLSMDTEP